MTMLSLSDSQNLAQSLPPAARAASANGAGVQTGDESFARTALVDLGLWSDGTHKFTFEKSTDGSNWTEMTVDELNDRDDALDPVDENSINVVDANNDNQMAQIDLLTVDDHVRAVTSVSGASTGLVSGVTIQNGHLLRTAGGRANPGAADGLLAEGATVF